MAEGKEETRDEPLLPIGAIVARLHLRYPDISHSSLRFLEREGLLTPSRTPGGHRLYSETDIARIIQIKEWQKQHLPLDVIRQRLGESSEFADLAGLSDTFVELGLAGRFLDAGRLLVEANDRGVPMLDIFANVLEPALVEVGTRWAAGSVLVSQEKQFSETSREVIAELSHRHAWIAPNRPAVIAACVQGNRHELGLRMIVGVLRSEGWPVHFLGASVAPPFLAEAIDLHKPRLVLLSIDMPERVCDLQDALEAIHREDGDDLGIRVVVGGRVASVPPDVLAPYGDMVVHGAGLRDVITQIHDVMSIMSIKDAS